MKKKITMNGHDRKAVAEVFGDFVISQTAQGLSEITLTNYRRHFHSISKHFDIQQTMDELTKSKLEAILKKPKKNCSFCEYRKWAIVNFMMNCGCCASTVRNTQNRDD